MSLFNTVARRNMLLAQIEECDGELTPELEEQLTISDDRLQESALFLLGLRETAQTNIVGAKAEMERLKAFIGTNQKAIDRIENELKAAAIRLGTINAGTYRITTKKSQGVVVLDENLLMAAYMRTIPATSKPDLKLIGEALKAGKDVEGAVLETRQNLNVK
jgi:chromosome segregation ATPase